MVQFHQSFYHGFTKEEAHHKWVGTAIMQDPSIRQSSYFSIKQHYITLPIFKATVFINAHFLLEAFG
jgi:hypothetical protein